MKLPHLKKDLHFFARPKSGILLLGLSIFLFSLGCTGNRNEDKASVKPMVYEGMSAEELKNILGEPMERDSTGSVFDANKGKTLKVQKWYFEKRTVVLIDDTVIKPNLPTINSDEVN